MSRIKSRWQTAALLILVAAAIAVPAWGSSGGSDGVQPAATPNGSDRGSVAQAAAGSEARDGIAVRPRPTREQLDQALQCMANQGFGMGTTTHRGEVAISRFETKTQEFRDAAKRCELPPPPTDAQIRKMACGDLARRRRDD
jgi:hypothetical protein